MITVLLQTNIVAVTTNAAIMYGQCGIYGNYLRPIRSFSLKLNKSFNLKKM